jgi:hypothetical protein
MILRIPIIAFLMLAVVGLVALVAFAATDAHAVGDYTGTTMTQTECHNGNNICVGLNGDHRIQVQTKSGGSYWGNVLQVVAYKDVSQRKYGHDCGVVEEGEEGYAYECFLEAQSAQRSKHLNYRCSAGQQEVGVFVVYRPGWRSVETLPSLGNMNEDHGWIEQWSKSHRITVTC